MALHDQESDIKVRAVHRKMVNFIAFDTEFVLCQMQNGGEILHPRKSGKDQKVRHIRRIVQFAAVKMDFDGEVIGKMNFYVNPGEEWVFRDDQRDALVCGINAETVRNLGKPFSEVFSEFHALFDENTVNFVAHGYHSAEKDVMEIECSFANLRYELPTTPVCTQKLWNSLEPIKSAGRGNSRLNFVFDYLFPGLIFDHHDALADSIACGKIFAMLRRGALPSYRSSKSFIRSLS